MKRSTNGKKPGPPVHDDLCAVVDQDGRTRHVVAADGPNELWLVDITAHRTAGGKIYCCAINNAFSGRIVGYSTDSRMKSRLAVQALENAVAMRGDVTGCIVHSDRGSPFSKPEVPACSGWPRHGRFYGQGGFERRQRGHGIVFRVAAEERPRPPLLGYP